MKQKMFLMVAVLGATVMLSGCGCTEWASQKAGEKIMEKAIESGTGWKTDIDMDKGQFSVKGEDGETKYSAGDNVSLPDNFPKDVFIYEDAKINMAISSSTESGGFFVSYVVSANESDVFSKYKEEMAKNGWKKETETDMGEAGKMIGFGKGESKTTVSIGLEDGENNAKKTTVGLNISIGSASDSSSESAGEETE